MTFETYGLDTVCFHVGIDEAKKAAKDWIRQRLWSFLCILNGSFKGAKEAEGVPYYEALKSVLEVDAELDTVSVRKKLGIKIGRDYREYEKSVLPTDDLLSKLDERGVRHFYVC